MKKNTVFITKAAVIAAVYAVLTLIGAAFGISYGPLQFRISEMLCVLPVFSAAAVPGLTAGCFAANIFSTVSPLDMILGTAATFLSALCSRKLKNVKIKNYPFLSFLCPPVFNALIIGAQTAFFASEKTFLTAFLFNSLTVFASETAVVFVLGSVLYFTLKKNGKIIKYLG